MRLPMKLGVSLASTTPLPRCTSQKCETASIAALIRFRRGNEFQQAHVTRRIEEVCPEPRAAEVVGESFRNFSDGQAAGVGGNDSARLANSFNFAKQRPLEVEILDDGLDDPVNLSQLLQVVVEVAHGDQAGKRSIHKGCGLGFLGRVKTRGSNLIARGRARARRNVSRNYVEQVAGHTGVGKMCGDAGAHGSGAEDGNFINAFHESASIKLNLRARSEAWKFSIDNRKSKIDNRSPMAVYPPPSRCRQCSPQ